MKKNNKDGGNATIKDYNKRSDEAEKCLREMHEICEKYNFSGVFSVGEILVFTDEDGDEAAGFINVTWINTVGLSGTAMAIAYSHAIAEKRFEVMSTVEEADFNKFLKGLYERSCKNVLEDWLEELYKDRAVLVNSLTEGKKKWKKDM